MTKKIMLAAAVFLLSALPIYADYSITVEATAYNAHETDSPCADGSPCIPYQTIAVDPSVIPLGSIVYVPGFGNMTASDTGGAISGNMIDIAMDSDSECYSWGRRTITVTVRE